ncbi:hypothetical protein ACH3XW_40570 [Acanthocheilonema viteae]
MLISLSTFVVKTILYILSAIVIIIFPFMQCSNKKRERKKAQSTDNAKNECDEYKSDLYTTEMEDTTTCTMNNTILATEKTSFQDGTTIGGGAEQSNIKQRATEETGKVKN